MTLEPIHATVYFSPLAAPAYEALGLVGREGYFGGRSAPLGAVSPEVVISTFFNFAPDLVRAAIPNAWTKASPEQILAVRSAMVADSFANLCADHVSSAATVRAAELIKPIALDACTRIDGRPLFAAYAALPWPDDSQPAMVLWHAQTLLREYRGDGHIAVLVAEGLSGLDAHVTHIATGTMPVEIMRSTRAWSDDAFEGAVDDLATRGIVTRGDNGVPGLTEAGQQQRRRIEDLTDQLSAAPYLAAGDAACAELRKAGRPLSQSIVDAGLSPMRRLPPAEQSEG